MAFCIYFSAKISLYRLQLPEIIASEPTILIVDNHPSRINSFAIEILTQNKIHLLTIPTHTSHILQQFDLTVAKSLKSLMNKSRIEKEINEFSKWFNSNAAQSRYIIVSSIINSWNFIKVETLTNGFKFTCIFPIDPNFAYTSQHKKW